MMIVHQGMLPTAKQDHDCLQLLVELRSRQDRKFILHLRSVNHIFSTHLEEVTYAVLKPLSNRLLDKPQDARFVTCKVCGSNIPCRDSEQDLHSQLVIHQLMLDIYIVALDECVI